LRAQVFAARKKWGEALDSLEKVQDAHLARPGLFLQSAELYRKLRQWEDAEKMYSKALAADPDNPHAHIGMCRVELHRQNPEAAAQAALEGLQRLYHNPIGHFLLGVSLVGLGRYEKARDAFQTALSLNPNYRQAHLRLGYLFKRRLGDPVRAAEHFRLFRELRNANWEKPAGPSTTSGAPLEAEHAPSRGPLPPLRDDEVAIVSGLPRSGTSMLMQMLAAGGLTPLTDAIRQPDEDNPRGYFEFEPVKRIGRDRDWLKDACGKVVKIVAPLLPSLPREIPCRVVFVDRNLDEILASQRRMLIRRGVSLEDSPARTERLKAEYGRAVIQANKYLKGRPGTHVLRLHRDSILRDPPAAAAAINDFLGGRLDTAAMAAAVDPSLHRGGDLS
jgi:tetratricopeptide (TPR) repeat protein